MVPLLVVVLISSVYRVCQLVPPHTQLHSERRLLSEHGWGLQCVFITRFLSCLSTFVSSCSRLTRLASIESAIGVLIPADDHAFVKFKAQPQETAAAGVVRSAEVGILEACPVHAERQPEILL